MQTRPALHPRPVLAMLAASVALALPAGCAGGGGGGGGGDAGTVALDGTAVDARVRNGAGDIFAIAGDGALTSLGTITTDAAGAYAFDLPAGFVGPIRLRLTSGTYKDGATGLDVTLSASSTLEAIANATGAPLTVHLSPFTTIAAKLFDEAPPATVDATAITAINQAVQAAFSLPGDITQVRPLDLTDPADAALFAADPTTPEAQSGLLVGALAQVAANAPGGALSVPEIAAALARDAADGALDGADAQGAPVGGLAPDSATQALAAGVAAFVTQPFVADAFTAASTTPPTADDPAVTGLQDEVESGTGAVPLPENPNAPTPSRVQVRSGGQVVAFVNAATQAGLAVLVDAPADALATDILTVRAIGTVGGTASSTTLVAQALGAAGASTTTISNVSVAAFDDGGVRFTATLTRGAAVSLATAATVVKDTATPTVLVSRPAAATVIGGAGHRLQVTVDGTGTTVREVEWLITQAGLNGGNPLSLGTVTTSPFALTLDPSAVGGLADGAASLSARALDRAGNAATSALVAVGIDRTPPALVASTPADGAFVAALASIVLDLEDPVTGGVAAGVDEAGTTITLTRDGAPLVAGTDFTRTNGVDQITLAFAAAADGAYVATVTPRDLAGDPANNLAGNVGAAATVTVTKDGVAPTAAITAPLANDIVGGTVSVTATAQDAVGVVSVGFAIEDGLGATVSSSDAAAPFEAQLDTIAGNLADGPATISIVASDATGNTATASIAVTIDNEAPVIVAFDPDGAAILPPAFTMTASATDGGAGLASARFRVGSPTGAPFATVNATGQPAAFDFQAGVSGLAHGFSAIFVSVSDAAGRTSTTSITYQIDAEAPSAAFAPAGGAVTALASSTLTITEGASAGQSGIDEVATAASITATFQAAGGGGPVAFTGFSTATSPNAVALTITTIGDGAYTFEATPLDRAGNAGALASVTYTLDGAPPQVVAFDPASGATSVSVGTTVRVTFSEDVLGVSTSTITLTDSAAGVVTSSVAYDAQAFRATLTPAAPLAFDETYTVTVGTGITDLSGNALAQTVTSSFTTTPPAPFVVGSVPGDGDQDIELSDDLVIEFSEAMDRDSVTSTLSIVDGAAQPIAGAFVWDAASTVLTIVFDPKAPFGTITGDDLLAEGDAITVTVSSTAESATGAPLGAAEVITFETVLDRTAPALVSTSPDLGAPVAAATPTIVFTFDEDMAQAPGFTFVDFFHLDERHSFEVGAGLTWTTARTLELVATQPLARRVTYRVRIDVQDASGNAASIERLLAVSSANDFTPPALTASYPEDGAVDVRGDSAVLLGFSESLAPGAAGAVSVTAAGTPVEVIYDANERWLRVVPLRAWPSGQVVTVLVSTAATDASGNALAAPVSIAFTVAGTAPSGFAVDTLESSLASGRNDQSRSAANNDFAFVFIDGAGLPAFVDRDAFSLAAVSLIEKASGKPVKGYRARFFEQSGAHLVLEVARELDPATTYTLALAGSLADAFGTTLGAAHAVDFTTAAQGQEPGPIVGGDIFPRLEGVYVLKSTSAGVERQVEATVPDVFNEQGGATLDAVLADDQLGPLTTIDVRSAFELDFDDIFNGLAAGPHLLSVDFENGAATTSLRFRTFLPQDPVVAIAPNGGVAVPGGVPTFEWSVPTSTAQDTDVLVLKVAGASGELYSALLPFTATSFSLPADSALAQGSYEWLVIAARFDDALRGRVRGAALAQQTFTVPAPTTPALNNANPADLATNVSVLSNLVLTFSEPMNRASVEAATSITMGGATIGAVFFWNAASTEATLVFDLDQDGVIAGDELLDEGVDVDITVGTQASSAQGAPLGAPLSLTFETDTDASPPVLVSSSPSLDAPIAPTSTLVFTFDEAIGAGPGFFFEVQLEAEAPDDERDLFGADGTQTVNGNAITVQLTQPLRAGHQYKVQLFLADTQGNSLTDDIVRFASVIDSADATAPVLQASVPASGATGVRRDAAVLLSFSEPMDPRVVDRVVVSDAVGALPASRTRVRYIPAIAGVLVTPRSAWPLGQVTIEVQTGAGAADISGNALASAASMSFETAGAGNGFVVDFARSAVEPGRNDTARSFFGLGQGFRFADAAGERVEIDLEGFTSRDVSVVHEATGIPVKGYEVVRPDDILFPDEPFGTYALRLNGFIFLQQNATYTISLAGVRSVFGETLGGAATVDFRTGQPGGQGPLFESDDVALARIEVGATAGQATLRYEVDVFDPNQPPEAMTLTVTDETSGATTSTPIQFDVADRLVIPAPAAGAHTLRFDLASSVTTATLRTEGFVFAESPGSFAATNVATPTLTWTLSQTLLDQGQAIVLDIFDTATGAVAYRTLLDVGRTSFTVPADGALPSGAYTAFIAVLRFDNALRGQIEGEAQATTTFTVP